MVVSSESSFPKSAGDFLIDEVVVKINPLGVFAGVAVIDLREARPVDRGKTHRARLATGVEFAVVELKVFRRRHASRMATISACAVGSLVEVT